MTKTSKIRRLAIGAAAVVTVFGVGSSAATAVSAAPAGGHVVVAKDLYGH